MRCEELLGEAWAASLLGTLIMTLLLLSVARCARRAWEAMDQIGQRTTEGGGGSSRSALAKNLEGEGGAVGTARLTLSGGSGWRSTATKKREVPRNN